MAFIKSYKSYMTKHLSRLFKKLERIRSLVDPSEEADSDEAAEAESIYYEAKAGSEAFVEEMTTTWEKAFGSLNAENPFEFWKDFGSPWDSQSESLTRLQESTLQALRSRANKIELAHFEAQGKLNAEIERLAEEENEVKLAKRLAQVTTMIDKKSAKYSLIDASFIISLIFMNCLRFKRYKSDFEEDCKIVKKCTDTVKREVEAMHAKIEKFIRANNVEPDPEDDGEKKPEGSGEVECRCDLEYEQLVLKDIELIGEQSDSLAEWKSRFVFRETFRVDFIRVYVCIFVFPGSSKTFYCTSRTW